MTKPPFRLHEREFTESDHPYLGVIKVPEDLPRSQWAPSFPIRFTYIFWGESHERPLYVGYTWDPGSRLPKHQRKPWFRQAKTVWIASYPSERIARAAESHLIGELNPIHNKVRPAA